MSIKIVGVRAMAMTAVVILTFGVSAAETGTKADPICSVAKLVERLTAANDTYHGQTRAATLYIAPGKYDVSAAGMPSYDDKGAQEANSISHLSVAGYILSGTTTNPRDVVITCNRTNRLFVVSLGGLEYLTVSNACQNGSYGAGVYTRGGTANICRHVILTDCQSILTDCQSKGGGGASNGGSWYDCTYLNNKVTNGGGGGACGGYYEDCFFTNNVATGGNGGAVYYSATLVNCRVIGNSTNKKGGGISAYDASTAVCTMRGGELAYNKASSDGGGSYNCNLLDGVVVHNNSASGGSGGGAQVNNTTISGCIVTNNTSRWAGGVRSCKTSLVTNTLIAGNWCWHHGGGLYMSDTSRIVDCVVSNNISDSRSRSMDAQGGGIYASSGVCISDTRICHNQLLGDRYYNNKNYNVMGGGLYSGVATNCIIDGNAVMYPGASEVKTRTLGGGAYGATLYDCKIYNNAIFGGRYGPAFYNGSAWHCVISNNISDVEATYPICTTGQLKDCTIGDGGVCDASLVNCRFVGCSNYVYLAKGANCATNGWFVHEPTFLNDSVITNCLFAENYFPKSIFFLYASKKGASMVNCTIVSNNFDQLFRAYMDGTNGVGLIENCIIVGNRRGSSEVNRGSTSTSGVLVSKYLSLKNNVIGPGKNNWSASTPEENSYDLKDSRLIKFVGGDGPDKYALKYGSPARNWGVVRDWMDDALDIRQDAQYPRLRDGKVDAGCYQCWLDPIGLYLLFR